MYRQPYVAWFLQIGLNIRDIGLLRDSLLPAYHATLVANGVESYSYEQLLSDMRFGALESLARLVWAFASFDFARDDATETPRIILGRAATVAEDLGCSELLR